MKHHRQIVATFFLGMAVAIFCNGDSIPTPIAFCKAQEIPEGCLNSFVQRDFIYYKNPRAKDYSKSVMSKKPWYGDCSDFALTFAQMAKRYGFGNPSIFTCRAPNVFHAVVEINGIFYDQTGGRKRLPSNWKCTKRVVTGSEG